MVSESKGFLWSIVFLAVAALSIVGCGGGGGGGGGTTGGGGGATTTTISGKVALSSTVGGSTALKAKPLGASAPMMANAKGRPYGKAMKGSPSAPGNRLGKVVQRAASQAASWISGATVSLYDADHPEWLYPVATADTDSNGSFTLSALKNAAKNSNAYTDAGTIPSGNYTLIAIGYDYSTSAVTTTTYPYYDTTEGKAYRLIVGVQGVVSKFEGDVTGNDLTVQSSDASPKVVSLMGKKTSDISTNSAGEYDLGSIASNSAIQVIFDMAMHRANTPNAIKLKDSSGTEISGTWKMSPDLTSATFYPSSTLTENANYKVTISSTATANYYGKGIKSDITAVYMASAPDGIAPNAILISPETQTGVDVTTAIKFAVNEAIDINACSVASTPSIGAKPTINTLGYKNVTGSYDYFYQVVPGDALQLGTTYSITLSGCTDLSGQSMREVTFDFQTASTSSGVTGTGTVADAQTAIKASVGKWVDAMNSSDVTLFASMLTGDFSMSYEKEGTRCDPGQDCSYDLNKDGQLSYDEFIKFIEAWFNENEKIPNWTGDTSGIHLVGEVVEVDRDGNGVIDADDGIKVDESTGTAAFAFRMTYKDENGNTVTGGGDSGVIEIYLILKSVNGSWYLSSISDNDNTGAIGTSVGSITTGNPTGDQSTGTKTLTFNWTTASGVSSYAVVLLDNADPTGSTGWVGIVDASNFSGSSATLDYSSVADIDASDGKIIFIGGSVNGPFSKELKLQDGGSYTWMVAGFKTLTASSFTTMMTKEPDSDIIAMSSGTTISIAGTKTATLMVTPQDSTGANLSFSDSLYAWNAGSASSATLSISTTSGSSEGKVYMYGTYYAEKPITFTNGTAKVTIDLFEGYTWIDVTDGVNWWYASTNQTKTSYASNYIYTTGGVSYSQLTVDSVTSGTSTLSMDAYGYYNIPPASTATKVTIKGKASAGTVYLYNSTSTTYDTSSAVVSSGSYTAEVPIYSGYNWISVYDGYGNWAYVNIYNAGSGATYQSPISDVKVNAAGPDGGTGTNYTVNTTSDVTISGLLKNSGNGYWYAYNYTNSKYYSGTLFNNSNSFSFPLTVYGGYTYVDLYDVNWNWVGITIYNSNTSISGQPNTITAVDGNAQTPNQYNYYYYTDTDCSVTIDGKSPTSAGKSIYVYLYNYNSTTGSIYDYQTITADSSGNYQFTMNVGAGTNYIDVYDSSWNWQGVQVTGGSGCTGGIITLSSDIYVGTTKLGLTSGWYYDASSASTVTVTGTAKAGKTVSVYLYAYPGSMYVSNTYTTTAYTDLSGNQIYSIDVPIYNGYNYFTINDGSNWLYPTVYTTGGATYTPPINTVKVDGLSAQETTGGSGGGASDTWGTWYTAADSATITGIGTVNGTGSYYLSSSYTYTSGSLNISNGTFSLPVNLDYGWNYISLYDANWNYYSVTIYTTGGNNAPKKYVTITSPAHNSIQNGNITVTGTVDTSTGFTPAYMYGYVYDYNSYSYKYYYWDGVTDANTIASWGYLPITYSNGAFSFSASVTSGSSPTFIEVDAYDSAWTSHGHYIYVNNTWGYGEYFYKPGKKASQKDTIAQAHKTEFLKKMMKDKARKKAHR